MPNHLNKLKTKLMGALLVATGLLNINKKFIQIEQKILSYEPIMSTFGHTLRIR